MKVAIWGATGATGSELLKQALDDERIDEVRTFGRRKTGLEHPKVRELIVEDFADANSYSRYSARLEGVDAAFWCLGVSQSAVPEEARYREITFDYTVVAAKALQAASPGVAFHFVSGMGAGRSARPMWARVKAETEEALSSVEFSRLVIWRPGYIHVPGGRENPTGWERAWEILSPLFHLVPGLVNPVGDIARAMLRDALEMRDGTESLATYGSRKIRRLGKLKTPN